MNPSIIDKMEENPNFPMDADYYMENGFLVFTESYHIKRGYCCGSSCRHCPYEHENVKVVKHEIKNGAV